MRPIFAIAFLAALAAIPGWAEDEYCHLLRQPGPVGARSGSGDAETILKELSEIVPFEPRAYVLYGNRSDTDLKEQRAAAQNCDDKRHIFYNLDFVEQIRDKAGEKDWAKYFVFAHEVAHHINNDTEDRRSDNIQQQELRADGAAAHWLSRMGASAPDLAEAVKSFAKEKSEKGYPDRCERVTAAVDAYNDVARNFNGKGAYLTLYKTVGKNPNCETIPDTDLKIERNLGQVRLPDSHRPAVAVFSFRNLSQKQEDEWLSSALAEVLSAELEAGSALRAIARERIARVERDLRIENGADPSADQLKRVQKNLDGTYYFVSGSYLASGSALQGPVSIELRVQDLRTGVNTRATLSGSQADLYDLLSRAGTKVREQLGIREPTQAEVKAATAVLPADTESLESYTNGVKNLENFKLSEAEYDLKRAINAAPKSARARLAMAMVKSAQGYDAMAKSQAAEASRLAVNSGREEQLRIDGIYRKLNGEWPQASRIYDALWMFFPDEIDYGLSLAEVQTEAGKIDDALATIAQLRKRATEDPRVDYQEAMVYSKRSSENKNRHIAAARAAQRATEQGAYLLAAQANWQDCAALLALEEFTQAAASCERIEGKKQAEITLIRARSATLMSTICLELGGKINGDKCDPEEFRMSALVAADSLQSRKDMIGARINLASVLASRGELDLAITRLKDAEKLAQEIDDKQQMRQLQSAWANVLSAEGEYEGAIQKYEQVRGLADALKDAPRAAQARANIASVNFSLGNLDVASAEANEIAKLPREKFKLAIRDALNTIGDLALARQDFEAARKAYEESKGLFALDEKRYLPEVELSLANLAIEQGDPSRAMDSLKAIAEEFKNARRVDDEAEARITWARALMLEKKLGEAEGQIHQVEREVQPQDRRVGLTLTIAKAQLQARRGNTTEATKLLDPAIADATKLKLKGTAFEARLVQAEIDPSKAESLAADAHTEGYLLIEAKARKIPR